jgi:hypothetical protein
MLDELLTLERSVCECGCCELLTIEEQNQHAIVSMARMDADDELRWDMGNEAYFALPDEEREERIDEMVDGGYEMTIDPADPVDPSPQFEFRLSSAEVNFQAEIRMAAAELRFVPMQRIVAPQPRRRESRSRRVRVAVASRGDPSRERPRRPDQARTAA